MITCSFLLHFIGKMLKSDKANTWIQTSDKGGTKAKKVWEPLLNCKKVIMMDNQLLTDMQCWARFFKKVISYSY